MLAVRAAKVGETREVMDDRIRANLKAMGLDDKVIQGAFKRASEDGNGKYTASQVVNHARQLMKSIRAEARGIKPAEKIDHIANSREQLHKHIDSLGVDSGTRAALRKIAANHTQVGATGKRGALTEAEQKAAIDDITEALKVRAAEAKASINSAPAGSKARSRKAEAAEKLSAAVEKLSQTVGSLKSDLANVRESEAQAKEAQSAAEKREQEAIAREKDMSDKLESFIKQFEADKAKAIADARADLLAEARGMSTERVEQFGKIVGEKLPDSVSSVEDPAYIEWKLSLDAAATELARRELHTDANFLKHFGDVVDKGLRRLAELPERPDLAIAQTDYEQLRHLYNKVKKGGELDVEESGNVQMGNMGQKLRTLLLGDASSSTRQSKIKYNTDKLEAERKKALVEKNGIGEHGLDMPDVTPR